MQKNRVIDLTNELYRITLLFPKKEPLRYKMRELADEILAGCVTHLNQISNPAPKFGKRMFNLFDVLDSFFEVAKIQNWIKPVELSNLQQEYNNVKERIDEKKEKTVVEESQKPIEMPSASEQLTQPVPDPVLSEASIIDENIEIRDRQKKILDILKQKEGVQVWEIQNVFPDVSKRTLRRDFKELLNHGLVERKGDKNTTFYQLKADRT